MTLRRSLTALLAAALLFTVAACSDDEPEDARTSSTTTTAATDDTTPETTTTVSDADYEKRISDAEAALAAAGDDLCAVIDASRELPPPVNAAQVERSMPLFRSTYEALAKVIEGDNPDSAAAFRSYIADALAAVEAAAYDPKSLAENAPEASDDVQGAWTAITTKYGTECAAGEGDAGQGDGAPATTAPAG